MQGALLPARASQLPAAVVDSVNGYLAAAPDGAAAAGAQHLMAVMSSQQAAAGGGSKPPLLQQLMPRLHAVFVVITGSHSKFWPALRQLLAPGLPVCTTFYGGSEGMYGQNVQMLLPGVYDAAAFPDPTQQQFALSPDGTCFFEFIPVDAEQQQEQGQQAPQAVDLAQLVVGRCYELVVTGFTGLCRFRVGDVVRVDGWLPYDAATGMAAGPPAADGAASCVCSAVPIISFAGRAGCALNLVWCVRMRPELCCNASCVAPAACAHVCFACAQRQLCVLMRALLPRVCQCREKYDEAQLLKAISDTCTALEAASSDDTGSSSASGAFPGLAEFTVQECIDDEACKHYAFYWELQQPAGAAPGGDGAAAVAAATLAAWEAALNRQLAACNEVYAGLLAAGQIAPARIRLVSAGSFDALRDSIVDARRISPSQFKMPTVVAPGSEHARLLQSRRVVNGGLAAAQQQL